MKKNVLALSITAALVGFGYAGGAQAIGMNTANYVVPSLAATLATSKDGVGHYLHVPYYSAQSGNNTMINIVNTDTTNGKAVKVRFRGAANSDDFYDFQVFLSPGDVWNASVSEGADGIAKLFTSDNTCTKPARGATDGTAISGTLNGTPFRTSRIAAGGTTAWQADQTREGYVEIFNMADIPYNATADSLFQTILHKSGKPLGFSTAAGDPTWGGGCTSTTFTALDTDPTAVGPVTTAGTAYYKGLSEPTGTLFANWIILNALDAGAWSGAAPALVAKGTDGVATSGGLVYFPQMAVKLTTAQQANLFNFTSDGWLLKYAATQANLFDVPDFSTPYTSASTPPQQAGLVSDALATYSLSNEHLTGGIAHAATDWIMSMPTRRYYTQYDYKAGVQLFSSAIFAAHLPTALPFGGTAYFTSLNTTVVGDQICVSGVSATTYDQEEYTNVDAPNGPIISPAVPFNPKEFYVCGEASVLAFNNGAGNVVSGALQGSVARSYIDNVAPAGWTFASTLNALNGSIGLPIVGYSAYRASNGLNSLVFGATLPHRTDLFLK